MRGTLTVVAADFRPVTVALILGYQVGRVGRGAVTFAEGDGATSRRLWGSGLPPPRRRATADKSALVGKGDEFTKLLPACDRAVTPARYAVPPD